MVPEPETALELARVLVSAQVPVLVLETVLESARVSALVRHSPLTVR
jgi:hypothetical protein